MNFHKYPVVGKTSISSYYSAGIPVAGIDIENMVYSWVTGDKEPKTDVEKEAVVRLMFHACASVKMTYSSQSSSATGLDCRTALIKYFDYDASIHTKVKTYYTNAEWNQLIKDELDAGRPILGHGTSVQMMGIILSVMVIMLKAFILTGDGVPDTLPIRM